MPRLGTGGNEIYVEPSTFSQYLSQAKKLCERYRFIGISLFVVTIAFCMYSKWNFQNLQIEFSTPECISSRVSERMDSHVDPCSDFYSFACGGFIALSEIPHGKLVLSAFTEVHDKVEGQLRALLSETIRENDLASFILVKKLYQQCMSSDGYLEELSLSFRARFGNWPLAKEDRWSSDRNWTKIIAEFRKEGYETDSILSVSIIDHPKNRSSRIILIGPPSFGLSSKLLIQGFNNANVNKYFHTMLTFAKIVKVDLDRAEIKLLRSLMFEIQLARSSNFDEFPLTGILTGIRKYTLFTLRNLQEKYPFIQWVEYINALLPSSVSVNEEEVVWVVGLLRHFPALEDLLKETPPDVIKTYLIWRAIVQQSGLLLDIGGTHNCVKIITKSMSMAVSSMYVRKYFNQTTREDVSKMVRAIRNELEFQLTESAWMDESTRNKSVDKLNEMLVNIGYPDELMNDFQIENLYNHSKIDESDFFSSILSMTKLNSDQIYAKLREPKQRGYWNPRSRATFIVDAEYLPTENGLNFPAAILQGNFFSSERPWYMNFGAMGFIIGHEFTHGYHSLYELPVSDGEFKTEQMFLERERCFENQYGRFTEPMTGQKVNGMRTLKENIADNSGFKLSYLAYQNWEKENGVEPKLPGLNYTSQQMFWISAAQVYCSIATEEYMDHFLEEDLHSPHRFRIIGSFRNSKEFAKDFKCPAGSPMNPFEKCEFW